MKEIAIKFNGIFNGLYYWGQGYKNSDVARKWEMFWKYEFPRLKSVFWTYAPPKDNYGSCGNLVSTGAAIYMHPMDFKGVFVGTSGVSTSTYVDGQKYSCTFGSLMAELKEICDACAEYCGGTFNLRISKEFEFEAPDYLHDLKEFTNEDDYPKDFGMRM